MSDPARTTGAPAAFLSSLLCALALVGSSARAETAPGDEFLAGYATAVLEQQLAPESFEVSVSNGSVRVRASGLQPGDAERIRQSLAAADGVRGVHVEVMDALPSADATASDAHVAVDVEKEAPDFELLPSRKLFGDLMADPRWPRFSMSYQRYLSDPELGNVGALAFGESFPLMGGRTPFPGRWQVGLQGGVFSIFDLDAPSTDLVNSDFLGGFTAAYRLGGFSSMLRAFHQSSHLGDEFLLRNRVDRVNLSFERVDLLLAQDFFDMLRLYGGGGAIVRSEPDLDPGSAQLGLEVISPSAIARGLLLPVAAVDVQFHQESGWDADTSLIAGVQVVGNRMSRLRLQILGEFYWGRSPNGQFFERDIEYAGIGLRLGL